MFDLAFDKLIILGLKTLENYMDDEIHNQVYMELAPCTDEAFLYRYMELHLEKFDEIFEVNGD